MPKHKDKKTGTRVPKKSYTPKQVEKISTLFGDFSKYLQELVNKVHKKSIENRFTDDKNREVFQKIIPILKSDDEEEEHTVFGIVLEPNTVDGQGDIYNEATIKEAAHRFMEEFQNMGLMHKEIKNAEIKILESFIAPADLEISGQFVKKGTWLLKARVLDDTLWQSIKSGELAGFSIGGLATSEPILP